MDNGQCEIEVYKAMIPSLRLTKETELANGQSSEPATAEAARPPEQAGPWLLTMYDLCRLLQRCRRSLEADVATGRIGPKPIRFGRALRFDADECQAWRTAGYPPRDRWKWNGQEIRGAGRKKAEK